MQQLTIQNVTNGLSRHKVASFCAAIMLFTTLILSSIFISVQAESDTTPMDLVDLTVDQTAIDVSSGEVEVQLGGEVFEDLSGFNSIEFFYLSPSGGQIIEGDANSDEQFIDEVIVFPQYAEPGVWRPTFTLVDEATNSITHGPDDLVGLGFSVDITVTSSPSDTAAPTVSAITIGSASVDTASSSANLTVDLTATDDLTGIDLARSQMAFVSPSGQRVGTNITNVSGDNYQSSLTFPQYSEVGTWTMELTLADVVTNTELYDATDLSLLSLPNSVMVTGNGDTTPVTVDALDFTVADPILSGGAGSAEVTVTADFLDNLSGFASATLRYISQTSTQIADSSSFFDGTFYQYTVTFPAFAATGTWLPEMVTVDFAGNSETLSHTDLQNLGFDMSLSISANETEVVGSGGSVTTDTGGDGATPAAPFEATVQTPIPGEISITQVALTEPESANDFLVYDQQYDIEAPTATPSDPLVLTFTIDADSLNGQTASTVQVFRNGILVADCLGSAIADPDPCVTQRNTLGDGDVELIVNTSQASIWVLGYEESTAPDYTFKRFKRPVKNPPKINHVTAGDVVKVKFRLNGESSRLDVLPPHVASSQRINCSTLAPIGNSHPVRLTKNGDLKIKPNGVYKFKWKTRNKWEDKCRQLILEFDNGETIYAYFDFDD